MRCRTYHLGEAFWGVKTKRAMQSPKEARTLIGANLWVELVYDCIDWLTDREVRFI